MAIFCPNLSDPQVKEDFNSLVSKLGENLAYYQWNKHLGNMFAINKEVNIPEVAKKPIKPIPKKRDIPKSAGQVALNEIKVEKLNISSDSVKDSKQHNKTIKEIEREFNLTSYRTNSKGDTIKMYNPLTPTELDKVEQYIKQHYLSVEDTEKFILKRVVPWNNAEKQKGLRIIGFPQLADENISIATERLKNEEGRFLAGSDNTDIAPLHKKSKRKQQEILDERKKRFDAHKSEIVPLLNTIDSNNDSIKFLQSLKDKNLITDERLLTIMDLILNNPNKSIKIETTFSSEYLEGEEGAYMTFNPSTNSIRLFIDYVLDPNYGDFDFFIRTLLHEYIHAYTYRIIKNPITKEDKKLAKEFNRLFTSAKSFASEQTKEKFDNAFTTPWEFVSELMTDPEFLQTIVAEQKYNWWQKFLMWLGKTFKTVDQSVFELVIKTIPTNSMYSFDDGVGEVAQMPLKEKIYRLRESLDIKDRKDFVKQLREFEKDFSITEDGIVHKDTNFGILAVTKVMSEFGFGIDPEELSKNQSLDDAIKRSNAIGTIVHGTAESILKAQPADLSNDLGLSGSIPFRKAMSSILSSFGGQNVTLVSEVYVSDLRKGIGGYIDLMIIDEKNKIHLYDFKTKEQGFDNYSKKYVNEKDGTLKFSAKERAHAQLTIYKETFQEMTGHTVSSVNAILLKPEVSGKKLMDVKLEAIDKVDKISRLGEDIYKSIKNVNMNIDPSMSNLIREQRYKTFAYKALQLSKLDNIIESVLTALQARLKSVTKRGNHLEVANLKEHIEKVKLERSSAESLVTLIKGALNRTANIIEEYNNAKDQGRDIKIGQLYHWKELVEAYNGFGEYSQYLKSQIPTLKKEAAKYAKQTDSDINKVLENVSFISKLYTEEGMDKLLDFLIPNYNRLRAEAEQRVREEYRKKPSKTKTEEEFVTEFFNQPGIQENLNESTKELLREELKRASRDIGSLGLWLSNLMDSRDPVMAAMVKAFAKQEYISHKEAIVTRDSIVKRLKEFEKTIDTGVLKDPKKIYDFLLEKENGECTGYLLDRFSSKLWRDYIVVIKDTNFLSLSKLKSISEDKESQISNISKFYYEKYNGVEETNISFDDIKDAIRKVWKDERTNFHKDAFLRDKAILLQEMLEAGELTELQIEEIYNNDSKFIKGESEITLLGLANAGIIPFPAAEKITNWIYRHAWDYRELKESYKKQYETKNFKEGWNETQHNLYNLMVELSGNANNKLPYSSRIGLKLPGVLKSSNEMIRSGQGLVSTFKEKLKSDFNVRPDDAERDNKELFSYNGKSKYFLPIHYIGEVEPHLQSYDVPTIMFKFWQSANDFNLKSEILPEMELAKFFIESRQGPKHWSKASKDKIVGIDNKSELKAYNNNLAKQVNEWFMTVVYGKPKAEQGKFFGLDVAKTIDMLNKYTSLNLLGLNLIQGVANTVLGESLQIAERIAGEYVSKKAYRKGSEFYLNNFSGILKDIGSRSPSNVATKLIEEFDILDDWEGTDFTSNKKYRNLMVSDTLFFTTHAGEHELQGRFLLSMLYDKIAYDKEGNSLGSMLHQYKVENGNLVLNDKVDLKKSNWTEKDQFEFSYKVRGVLSRLHGEYTDLGKVALQRGALGRMAFMFRKFIEPGFQRRWGKRDYVERLGGFVEGSYVTFFQKLMVELWKHKFNVGASWDTLDDHQKANVKRTITEIGFLLLAILVANLMIGKMGDGDDDNEAMLAFVAYQAVRLKSELLFFINPGDTINILRSPMASMSVIENVSRILVTLTSGDPFDKFERGPWKDQLKLAKYATNMVPAYRQIYRIRDIEDQLSWFSQRIN